MIGLPIITGKLLKIQKLDFGRVGIQEFNVIKKIKP